jgi:chromosomal replication initiator protein
MRELSYAFLQEMSAMETGLLPESSSQDLWISLREILRARIPETALNTWFTTLECLGLEAGIFTIGVPNAFVLEYVEHQYKGMVESALAEVAGMPLSVEFTVLKRPSFEIVSPLSVLESEPEAHEVPHNRPSVKVDVSIPLNFRYKFDNFVIGDCNQLAHAACMAVSESPSCNKFNPLVIYGGTGMGKTHLLQAIAHFCLENETVRKIVYRTSEEFTREYIEFVQKNRDSRAFYQVYKDTDILLIDDIQFLAGKHSTQDEFFNIFSVLQSLNRQIVITSDRPPSEIKGLHTRLLSRFDTGLLADLTPPNLETRLAILQKRAEMDPTSCINDDVLSYVANQVTSNVRELEGTLIKLSAYASFTHTPITVEIAKEILGDTLRNQNRRVTIRRILDVVALEFDLSVSLLTSQTRKKNVAEPRHLAMYLARRLTDNSLHTIGLAFGRDYSTVIHSIKRVEQGLEKEPSLRGQVDRLLSTLS